MGECLWAAAAAAWDLSQGYLFPLVKSDGSRATDGSESSADDGELPGLPPLRGRTAPTREHAVHHALIPSGKGREPLTRRYGGSGNHVTCGVEVCRGSPEEYRGNSSPPRGQGEAGEPRTRIH